MLPLGTFVIFSGVVGGQLLTLTLTVAPVPATADGTLRTADDATHTADEG